MPPVGLEPTIFGLKVRCRNQLGYGGETSLVSGHGDTATVLDVLPDFRLETHFAKWEFVAEHHLTASDAESMSMRELLAMATPEQRAEFDDVWLGYTETWGAPDLREAVGATFAERSARDVLCFTGASEGIFAANQVLLDRDSHAIVVTPNYQSHETLPQAICDVTGVPLDGDDGWSLDIDRVAAAICPTTKLVTINFPHNPTGAILPLDRYRALIDLCRTHGIWILHDEIFHGLGSTRHPASAVHRRRVRARPFARCHVEVVRPSRSPDRVDRLPEPRRAPPHGADEALPVDLQLRPE